MYKQVKIVTSKGALFWVSVVMVGVGCCKYVERLAAFWKADFGNIRSSSSNEDTRRLKIQPVGRLKLLGNEQALLLAHELLGITLGAFSDHYMGKEEDDLKNDANLKDIFFNGQWGNNSAWQNMCKLVEMELSLMYDILYTKAAVIHNWCGYVIRMVSLAVTTTVILLFSLQSEDGQRTADVVITYILLGVTFLLDVRWLLGAAASTWTYAFFNASPARWLHHEVCCTRWWRRLRRFVVSLDPWQMPLREHGGGYRLWSGIIGQYNLFHECTHGGNSRGFSCWPLKKLPQMDAWKDYKYSSRLDLDRSKHVKELLFQQIQQALNMAPPPPPLKKEEPKPAAPKPPAAKPPVEAPVLQRRRELDEELDFLPECQELILIWHVTTDVFLSSSKKQHTDDQILKYMEAIKAISDYMAFLAAVRPDMLPGLKLRSQHRATAEALSILWKRETSKSTSPYTTTRGEEKLVEILKREEDRPPIRALGNSERSKVSALYNLSIILSDATTFGELLEIMLRRKDWKETLDKVLKERSNSWKRFVFLIPDMEKPRPKPFYLLDLLKLMLKSWVRMLIYVSIRCSRDSHAKQLGRGCELTTIVWILSEHAGIFASKPPMDDKSNS